MKIRIDRLIAGLLLCALAACNDAPKEEVDTATSGRIRIAIDETFQPLGDAQLQAFHNLYKKARIDVSYKPEVSLITDLLNDSVRSIMISRLLTSEETEVLADQKLRARALKVAVDGLAVVLHPDNPAERFTLSELTSILAGRQPKWEKTAGQMAGDIVIVFDNPHSSTVRYLSDSLLAGQKLSANAFAANTNAEVVAYVAQHPNAIGFIGLSWISDTDDTLSTSFLRKIKVAALKEDRPGRSGEYCKPYQAYLSPASEIQYPLRRDVYLITREARTGLGTGFASFVSSQRGQRIVLKSGLLPATMPVRLVQIEGMSKLEKRMRQNERVNP